jgi:drug/metabolite transporter (DMT)-like permease
MSARAVSAAPQRGLADLVGARPALAATAGAITIAFSAILVALADVPPSTAAIFRCAYALPLLGALAAWERHRFGPRGARERRLALIAGTFFAVDLVCWHHAIDNVGAGLATVLGNLQVVIIPFVAWAVLNERPERKILAALPVVMIGVVLISGALEQGAYGADPARGVLFGVLTGGSYAGFILVLRHGSSDLRRPAGPLFEATAVGAAASVALGLALGEAELVPTWPEHAWLVTLALTSQVLGWLFITTSLPRLPAALTSLILCLQPVGSVVLGVILLGEAPSGLQLAGAACILAALLGIARRRR